MSESLQLCAASMLKVESTFTYYLMHAILHLLNKELNKSQGLTSPFFFFNHKLLIQQFLHGHYWLCAALPRADTQLESRCELAFAVLLVDRRQEQLIHPVGFGKKTGDMMSCFKQVPTFIFGIISWMWGDECFHTELKTGNKKVKGTQTLMSKSSTPLNLVCHQVE